MDVASHSAGPKWHSAPPAWAGAVPFIVGLLVVALLIGAVVWRTRSSRSRPPRLEGEPSHLLPPRNAPTEPCSADDFGGPGEGLSPHQMTG
ncbi:DUF6479 family protein [Streptomyces rubiginosohelvolus]|uniref:DUF6479 family protein n=1 Tax=Streptomyces rubiginosohelvolus TaxID=67362 RepID=UPI0036F124A1